MGNEWTIEAGLPFALEDAVFVAHSRVTKNRAPKKALKEVVRAILGDREESQHLEPRIRKILNDKRFFLPVGKGEEGWGQREMAQTARERLAELHALDCVDASGARAKLERVLDWTGPSGAQILLRSIPPQDLATNQPRARAQPPLAEFGIVAMGKSSEVGGRPDDCLANASERLWILGRYGHPWLDDEHLLERLVARSREIDVRLLLVDRGHVPKEHRQPFIHYGWKLRKAASKGLSVRLYRHAPEARVIIVDHQAFLTMFTSDDDWPEDKPMMRIGRGVRSLMPLLERSFEAEWTTGVPVRGNNGKIQKKSQNFGKL